MVENMNHHRHHKDNDGRVVFGFILLIIGGALVARHLGLIPFPLRHVIWSWQMLLIVIGTLLLASKSNRVGGVVLILVGGFFLLPDFVVIPFHYKRLFWPVLLIIIGLLIIFRGSVKFRMRFNRESLGDDYIDYVDVFGGGDRKITTKSFKGGRLTAIFGGSSIDLINAEMAEDKAEIDITFIFGGSKLIVPKDWHVRTNVTTIFGGFSDGRTYFPENDANSKKVLVIKGVAIFGGGEIKNF